jgi:hypothetical protein
LQEDSREAGVAHGELARLYLEPPVRPEFRNLAPGDHYYPDLALQHRKEQLRLARLHGALPGEKPDDTDNRIRQLEDIVERLGDEVDKQKLQFGVGSMHSEPVLSRAARALQMGLGEEALQTLLQSKDVEFGAGGARLEINLLLNMGRVAEARRLLTDKEVAPKFAEGALGGVQFGDLVLPAYPWFLLVLAEVAGDDAEADTQLKDLCDSLHPPKPGDRTSLWFLVGNGVLDALPRPGPSRALNSYRQFLGLVGNPIVLQALPYVMAVRGPQPAANQSLLLDLQLMQYALMHRRYADTLVLRGILALDHGDTKAAREHFGEARRYAETQDRSRLEFDSFARPARHYLELLDSQK